MADRTTLDNGVVFHRQLGIFDPSQHQMQVTIIGAGAIGSYVALNMAKVGFDRIKVWDHDIVETHNQPGQLYGLDDRGFLKVERLRKIILALANVDIDAIPNKWEGQDFESGIVVSAVDSMEVRKQIFAKIRMKMAIKLFLDGRIGGQDVRLFAVRPTEISDLDRYVATLHTDADAVELPCTERSVSDINFLVASMMIRQTRTYLTDGDEGFVPEIAYNAKMCQFIPMGVR